MYQLRSTFLIELAAADRCFDFICGYAHEQYQLHLFADGICHWLKGDLLIISAHNDNQFLLERTQSSQYTCRTGGNAVIVPLDTVQFADEFDTTETVPHTALIAAR